MVLGLVSAQNKDGDIPHNIEQIEAYMKQACKHHVDMLVFGESFLQGFEGLTWDYEKDKTIAQPLNSPVMTVLMEMSKRYGVALSLGLIENKDGILYSSNVVIDEAGTIRDVFHRVSDGWREPSAGPQYKEGEGFHTFSYKGKTFSTAICGDLWYDENLEQIKHLKMDICLWPLYVDYPIARWEEEDLQEYCDRVKNIPAPVCMVNSYVEADDRANGGCYVFYKNKVTHQLNMGQVGMLCIEI